MRRQAKESAALPAEAAEDSLSSVPASPSSSHERPLAITAGRKGKSGTKVTQVAIPLSGSVDRMEVEEAVLPPNVPDAGKSLMASEGVQTESV